MRIKSEFGGTMSVDIEIFNWLLDKADAPIRYRVARELLHDDNAAKEIQDELIKNPTVELWLKRLKPETPPQHRDMPHGSFDFCLENALPKALQLGLHGGFAQLSDAVMFYIDGLKNGLKYKPFRNRERDNNNAFGGFNCVLAANLLSIAGVRDESVTNYLLGSLDELYGFVKRGGYNIYLSEDELSELKGVPKGWRNRKDFIKPELTSRFGFCYPLIYDVLGLKTLYGKYGIETDNKINSVIDYITCDDFHERITDGYGILSAGERTYHGMGWSPHYPGWHDAAEYIKNGNVPRLLFFAQHIAAYPSARKTKWFSDLQNCLEKYRTGNMYIFPKEWLAEKTGYAVMGCHLSFGENRRKKNWNEIESTFYMQLLNQEC